MTHVTKTQSNTGRWLRRLVDAEDSLRKLPPLTSLQRAKLDHARAIDHLYYSSKIEGTNLSEWRLEKAIHGNAATPTK